MIASVSGEVSSLGLDHVVVEVGGVGLLVRTTPGTAGELRPGAPARLATSLVVREESLTLYGFGSARERDLFDVVQTVSGVGPRLALAMLAVHSPEALRAAISQGDTAALTKVPGIGKKGAERLVLELRDKVGAIPSTSVSGDEAGPPSSPEADHPWRDQVRDALVNLGWSAKQADEALSRVEPGLGDRPTLQVALRAALKELGR